MLGLSVFVSFACIFCFMFSPLPVHKHSASIATTICLAAPSNLPPFQPRRRVSSRRSTSFIGEFLSSFDVFSPSLLLVADAASLPDTLETRMLHDLIYPAFRLLQPWEKDDDNNQEIGNSVRYLWNSTALPPSHSPLCLPQSSIINTPAPTGGGQNRGSRSSPPNGADWWCYDDPEEREKERIKQKINNNLEGAYHSLYVVRAHSGTLYGKCEYVGANNDNAYNLKYPQNLVYLTCDKRCVDGLTSRTKRFVRPKSTGFFCGHQSNVPARPDGCYGNPMRCYAKEKYIGDVDYCWKYDINSTLLFPQYPPLEFSSASCGSQLMNLKNAQTYRLSDHQGAVYMSQQQHLLAAATTLAFRQGSTTYKYGVEVTFTKEQLEMAFAHAVDLSTTNSLDYAILFDLQSGRVYVNSTSAKHPLNKGFTSKETEAYFYAALSFLGNTTLNASSPNLDIETRKVLQILGQEVLRLSAASSGNVVSISKNFTARGSSATVQVLNLSASFDANFTQQPRDTISAQTTYAPPATSNTTNETTIEPTVEQSSKNTFNVVSWPSTLGIFWMKWPFSGTVTPTFSSSKSSSMANSSSLSFSLTNTPTGFSFSKTGPSRTLSQTRTQTKNTGTPPQTPSLTRSLPYIPPRYVPPLEDVLANVLPQNVAGTVAATGVAVATLSSVATPGASSYSIRMMSIVSGADCSFNEDDMEPSILEHPVQLTLYMGSESYPLSRCAGSMLCSLLLFVMLPSGLLWGTYWIGYRQESRAPADSTGIEVPVSENSSLKKDGSLKQILRFQKNVLSPLWCACVAYFGPAVFGTSILIMFHSSHPPHLVLAAVAALLSVSVLFIVIFVVGKKFMVSKEAAAAALKMSKEAPSPSKRRQKKIFGFLNRREGVEWKDATVSCYSPSTSGLSVTFLKTMFHVIDGARDVTKWYVRHLFSEELVVAYVMAFVANVRPQDPTLCLWIALILLAAAVLHVLYLCLVWPHTSKLEMAMLIILSVVQMLLAIACVAATQYPKAMQVVAVLVLIQLCLFPLELAVFCFWAYARYQQKNFKVATISVSDTSKSSVSRMRGEEGDDGAFLLQEALLGEGWKEGGEKEEMKDKVEATTTTTRGSRPKTPSKTSHEGHQHRRRGSDGCGAAAAIDVGADRVAATRAAAPLRLPSARHEERTQNPLLRVPRGSASEHRRGKDEDEPP